MGEIVIFQRGHTEVGGQKDWRTRVRRLQGCQQRGFHIARMILSDAVRAEDALQDANEKAIVKLRAGFVPEDLNKWFVVLVLNAARNQYRSEHRRKRREEFHAAKRQAASSHLPEVHRDLAEALAQLDEQERLPISLHYAMGYSQKEVSKFLELSERTVSYRIANGLKRLRALLTAGGRSLAPAVVINLMEEQTALPVPQRLELEAQKLFEGAAAEDLDVSAEASSLKTRATALGLSAAACTMALSAWMVFGWQTSVPKASASPRSPSRLPSKAGLDPQMKSAKAPVWQDRRWTFEHGLSGDFQVLLGSVQTVPASNGRRASILSPRYDGALVKKPLILNVDIPLPPESIYMKVHCRAVEGSEWVHMTSRLLRGNEFLPYRESDFGHLTFSKHELVFRVCIIGSYLIEVLDERINRICRMDDRKGNERIALMAANYEIEEISLKKWQRHQFPENLQDPVALLKQLKPRAWNAFKAYPIPASPRWTEQHRRHLIKNKDVPLSEVYRKSE